MDLKQIKELMAAMEKADMESISITEKDFKIELVRGKHSPHPAVHSLPPAYYHSHPEIKIPVPHRIEHTSSSSAAAQEKKVETGRFVTSPMVGTLYTAPSPEDPPFIKVGDKIDENTVVCIIEAMKVMNEVKAGVSGTIAELYVDNSGPVEFGTRILRVV